MKGLFLKSAVIFLTIALSAGATAESGSGAPVLFIREWKAGAAFISAPQKHHFNLQAPNKAYAIQTRDSEKLPLKLEMTEHSAEIKIGSTPPGKRIHADLFICDDAGTFCVKKPLEAEVPKAEKKSPEIQSSALPVGSAWIRPEKGVPVRNVTLVLHGLNVRPEGMDEWAQKLAAQGSLCLRASLTGHHGDPEAWSHVTRADWQRDFEVVYRTAKAEADSRKVPLHFLGYSLGALIAADVVAEKPESQIHFDKMILLAPALSVHFGARFLGALGFLGESIRIPSFAVPEYKANRDGTSLAAYRAVSESVHAVEEKPLSSLNVPTLVIIDPDDGLVRYRGLQELVKSKGLDQWKYLNITTAGGSHSATMHHFLLSESGFGSWVWNEIQARVARFLCGEDGSGKITRADYCGQSGEWKTRLRSGCRQDHWAGCDRTEFDCQPVNPRG